MTSDGTNTYERDAENRLIKINYPGIGNYSSFRYDASGRVVSITEMVSSALLSERIFVRSNNEVEEDRTTSGVVAAKYFARGLIVGPSSYFTIKDHLGTIRGTSAQATGTLTYQDYDLIGNDLDASESRISEFGFADYFIHRRSGLYLTVTRAYLPRLGFWLSRDLIGEAAGANLYSYVGNSPAVARDPSGLAPMSQLSSMLQSMCGNPRCKVEDQSKCKADALVLANAIQDVWKNAPAGRHTGKKDNVRGYMCWEWALGFASAGVAMEVRNSVTSWSRDYREWHEYEHGSRFHMGTRFTPAGANPNCCGITVDDGFLSEGNVHDPSWNAAGWHETPAALPMSNGEYGPTQNPWRNLHP